MTPHLRIARPTDRLDACVSFYRDAVGLSLLGGFQDHAGFDGVMLGLPGEAWHLELTHHRGHSVGGAPNADHLVVLYVDDAAEFAAAVARFTQHGHAPVPSFNPYWDIQGKTFVDPDGYRVVLQNAAWQP